MKTAKELAGYASLADQLCEKIKAEDSDPYAPALNLAAYHLYSAAKALHRVAEARAASEGATK